MHCGLWKCRDGEPLPGLELEVAGGRSGLGGWATLSGHSQPGCVAQGEVRLELEVGTVKRGGYEVGNGTRLQLWSDCVFSGRARTLTLKCLEVLEMDIDGVQLVLLPHRPSA